MEHGGPGAARLTRDGEPAGGPPQVTVLVCTHNDEATIGEAIGSALCQSLDPGCYRLLVVDDGSTDATGRVADELARGSSAEVIHLPVNRGLVPACNAGLNAIDTPYTVRLDGDDRLEPRALEALLETAAAKHADLVYPDRWEVPPTPPRRLRRLRDDLVVSELIASGVLLSTRAVKAVGGYRDLFWEEYDLYLRLLETVGCRPAHVPEALYFYRIGAPERMTSSDSRVESGWRELRRLWPSDVLERHGLGPEVSGVPGRDATAD